MKLTKTILVTISILSACVLWFTRGEYQPSLSAFALSDNATFYRIMHITGAGFFLLDAQRKEHNYLLAIGMGLILAFDMYHNPLIHNIATALTIVFACFTLIYYTNGFRRHLMIFLSAIAVFIFCLGYFTKTFHFLLAEIIVMACIMNGKLLEIWE